MLLDLSKRVLWPPVRVCYESELCWDWVLGWPVVVIVFTLPLQFPHFKCKSKTGWIIQKRANVYSQSAKRGKNCHPSFWACWGCQGGILVLLTVQLGTGVHLAYLCTDDSKVWCTYTVHQCMFVVHSSDLFEVRCRQCLVVRWMQINAHGTSILLICVISALNLILTAKCVKHMLEILENAQLRMAWLGDDDDDEDYNMMMAQ